MLGNLASIIISLPAALGVPELLRKISFRFMHRERESAFTVVPMWGGEDSEFVLRSVLNRVKWLDGTGHRVWILDCGMDDEAKKICGKLVRKYSHADILTPEELCAEIVKTCGEFKTSISAKY